ncbi:alpha/beta hydrolase [Aspergillus melleus]|uniref:alpha/beta hydrolase n=1 Tax=Aspergillus melleus TaxID=138277 RepID=UPI001E8D369A|nr:uncharacterized protein LDX57_012623 [Aspergillus melleus]KAH8434994.1 hypothetical protein LDX57_012623 [Aspergillus melleus]
MPPSKTYLTPLVIPPLRPDKHTHTLILLHGRGSNSERFVSVFLETTEIAHHLATTKFVFPTAKKRRSTVLNRIPIHQWFDNYSLDDPNTQTEIHVEGLEESGRFLRTLVDEEARLLGEYEANGPGAGNGYGRVVVGGLSQGCAASVFCLLAGWEDGQGTKRLGGFVGMSGWLPFERDISGLLGLMGEDGDEDTGDDDDDDPFFHDDEEKDIPASIQALNLVRDVLDLPPLQGVVRNEVSESRSPPTPNLQTPVFLGHGSADPKVSVQLGQRMASVLSEGFGMDVTWKAYKDFGHWYKVPDEIDDVVHFLKEKVGIPGVG